MADEISGAKKRKYYQSFSSKPNDDDDKTKIKTIKSVRFSLPNDKPEREISDENANNIKEFSVVLTDLKRQSTTLASKSKSVRFSLPLQYKPEPEPESKISVKHEIKSEYLVPASDLKWPVIAAKQSNRVRSRIQAKEKRLKAEFLAQNDLGIKSLAALEPKVVIRDFDDWNFLKKTLPQIKSEKMFQIEAKRISQCDKCHSVIHLEYLVHWTDEKMKIQKEWCVLSKVKEIRQKFEIDEQEIFKPRTSSLKSTPNHQKPVKKENKRQKLSL